MGYHAETAAPALLGRACDELGLRGCGASHVRDGSSSGAGATHRDPRALRASDGSELWRYDVPEFVSGGPAIGNGVLFVATQGGKLFALDAVSGKSLWQDGLPRNAGGGFSLACSTLVIGHGFHSFESQAEPLRGGLRRTRSAASQRAPPTVRLTAHLTMCCRDM